MLTKFLSPSAVMARYRTWLLSPSSQSGAIAMGAVVGLSAALAFIPVKMSVAAMLWPQPGAEGTWFTALMVIPFLLVLSGAVVAFWPTRGQGEVQVLVPGSRGGASDQEG